MELAEQVVSYEEDFAEFQRENVMFRAEISRFRQSQKDSQEAHERNLRQIKDRAIYGGNPAIYSGAKRTKLKRADQSP